MGHLSPLTTAKLCVMLKDLAHLLLMSVGAQDMLPSQSVGLGFRVYGALGAACRAGVLAARQAAAGAAGGPARGRGRRPGRPRRSPPRRALLLGRARRPGWRTARPGAPSRGGGELEG